MWEFILVFGLIFEIEEGFMLWLSVFMNFRGGSFVCFVELGRGGACV